MQRSELTPLLDHSGQRQNEGLTVLFAIICIVDVFGVFPVIALPKTLIDCEVYGILIIVVVCSLQLYTATLLGKCWMMAEEIYPDMAKKSRYPYSALAEITYGKMLSNFVTILLDLTIFGGGIPNLIVASQNLQLLGLRLSENSVDVSFCLWIIVLGAMLCPILWLGSPKDMKVLCTVSVIIVSSVFVLTLSCLVFTTPAQIQPKDANLEIPPRWRQLLLTYGIITFQFDIHPSILTIHVDMENKSKLPLAITGGFAASLVMSGVTTIIAFFKYGKDLEPSILETLPSSPALHLAALLVAVQLCLTSGVSNNALYQHMEDCLCISREFNHKRCILRTILTILSIVIAESVPKFDLVMSLIGGTLTGPLVFILPPLFYIRMVHLHNKRQEWLATENVKNMMKSQPSCSKDLTETIEEKIKNDFQSELNYRDYYSNEIIFCVIIVLISSCASAFSTYVSITDAALSYSNVTKPCIYNLSNALLYM